MKRMLSRIASTMDDAQTSADIEVDGVILDTPKRKRVVPLWRRPQTILAYVFCGLIVLGGSGAWVLKSGWGQEAITKSKWELIKVSANLGFTLNDVLVAGRKETDRKDLLTALGIVRGAPILAFDFETARARVEALPWVQHAKIERFLPNTLSIHLIERQPIALWQNQGDFALIDEEGQVIIRQGLARFSHLIHVVGSDAPNRVGGLLELLGTQPKVLNNVMAAVRVGGRRWDLLMLGGVDVRLPENNIPGALARLVAFEAKSGVLSRDVKILDLRLPDRIIVRKSPTAIRKPLPMPGQET